MVHTDYGPQSVNVVILPLPFTHCHPPQPAGGRPGPTEIMAVFSDQMSEQTVRRTAASKAQSLTVGHSWIDVEMIGPVTVGMEPGQLSLSLRTVNSMPTMQQPASPLPGFRLEAT